MMKQKMIAFFTVLCILTTLFTNLILAEDMNINQYTPYDVTATLLPADETHPYGSAYLTFKINNLLEGDDNNPWYVYIEKKIGNGEWIGVDGGPAKLFLENYSLGNNAYYFEQLWIEDYEWTSDIIISYRINVWYADSTYSAIATSSWSNIATLGLKASSWAVLEIERAISYGLVPESIKQDYTMPITREEFAELAVKLYEVYTKKSASLVATNPFTDCNNSEVLKAFNLGIVRGVSDTTFVPKDKTNREQISAMLYRAITVISPETDMSTTGAPVFKDANKIESYFLENVKFMSLQGFIKGDNGNFDPKGTCSREMAILIAVRVYEKYAGITQ